MTEAVLSERDKGLTVLGGSSMRGPDPSLKSRSESTAIKPAAYRYYRVSGWSGWECRP